MTTPRKPKKMPRSRAPKATGRLPLDISEERVEGMAWGGGSIEDIADALGCSRDTLERRFAAIFRKHRGLKKVGLTQAQYRSAIGTRARVIDGVRQDAIPPNVSAQIWLGKQWLCQSDKVEIPVGGDGEEKEVQSVFIFGKTVRF